MSMWGRRRDAHQVTRNNGRQDPELGALRARGHTLLAANWRARIRGDRRPPVRPFGLESSSPSLSDDQEIADIETRASTNGPAPRHGRRDANGSQKNADAGILMFPEIVLLPPEKPVRGPLCWAYWSARRK